jgi:hypothetical protein
MFPPYLLKKNILIIASFQLMLSIVGASEIQWYATKFMCFDVLSVQITYKKSDFTGVYTRVTVGDVNIIK